MKKIEGEPQLGKTELDKPSQWFIPIALGCITVSLIWLTTDIETNMFLWDVKGSYFRDRIYALILVIVCAGLIVRIQKFLIQKFSSKKKHVKEYVLFFVSSLVIFNLALLFITFVINKQGFSAKLTIRGNTIGIPLFMFFHFYMRSKMYNTYYTQQSLQFEKMKSQQFSTELDYLKAQYHPHFLFNALNTVYFQIDEENPSAKHTVELLSNLLRYQIYDIKNLVTLEQEIEHLKTYIEFQKMRMSERLTFDLNIDAPQPQEQLHPLLFQPLIENAFKYVRGEKLSISCRLKQTPSEVQFTVQNTIDAVSTKPNKHSGVGIANLRRRLELLYPKAHKLEFEHTSELFCATLTIITKK